jgi:outer membrane cobalamin receptor
MAGKADEVGNDLPYRSRTRAYARATAAPGPAELHLEVHQVGRRFEDARNKNPIRATVVWNAGAAWRLLSAPRLRLHLQVLNLADVRTSSDGFGNPLPGRMVMLTLRAGSTED